MIRMWRPFVLAKPGVGTVYLARRRKRAMFVGEGRSRAHVLPYDRIAEVAAAATQTEAMAIIRRPADHQEDS